MNNEIKFFAKGQNGFTTLAEAPLANVSANEELQFPPGKSFPLIGQPKIKMMFQARVKKLRPDAIVPTYGSEGAAGADLYACLIGGAGDFMSLEPGDRALISTGVAIALYDCFEAQVRPRSGLALKHGVTVLNAPGTIDSDYRGEIGAILINHGSEPFTIKHGDRIAQLVIQPILQTNFVEVDEFDETARGTGGYGSTGR